MKSLFALLFTIALAIGGYAQAPSKILKQAEKALGGTKVLRSTTSMTKSGRIRRVSDGAEGNYLEQTSQPNLLNTSFDIAGFEMETGYNGRSGWSRNSRDGLQTLTGKESVAMQTLALFRNNLWWNYKKEKSRIASGGQAVVNGRKANVVVLTTQKGVVLRLFFDAVTSLLVKEILLGGANDIEKEYSDHRGQRMVAFSERLSVGGETYEIWFDDVNINPKIARSEFDFPVRASEPLPDITALLGEVQAQQDKVEEMLETYSFTQKNIKRELGKDGVLREKESETFKLTFYKGRRIRRLIEKNGKPLSANDQAEEDKKTAKEIEEIEKKAEKEAKREIKGPPSEEDRRISIAEVMRASRLINPRRERFRGRDVIVFDFEPNPAFDMKNAKSMLKFFGKTAGVMWIDEKDKQVARLEAVLFESFKVGGGLLAKLQKGASFSLEQERVNDEIWLPSQAEINLSVRVLLVKGIDLNQVIKSYDYGKFGTEVKDATVGAPVMP